MSSPHSRYADRTVKELRERAKAKGLHGYSKLKKEQLIAQLGGVMSPRSAGHVSPKHIKSKRGRKPGSGPTVKELREEAKRAGHKGYSKMKKAELMALLGR
jgi:hypothetical protein